MDTHTALNTIGPIMMAVRKEMIWLGEQHSCILTSAVLTEVLRGHGYPNAYALRVRVTILNRQMTEFIKKFGPPSTPDSMGRCEAAGGVMAKLGEPGAALPEDRWPGHAEVKIPGLVSDGAILSDPTITQVNGHDLGFDLPPFLATVSQAFLAGQKKFGREVGGCQLIYTAFPGDLEHEATGLWRSRDGIVRVAEMVTATL